MAGDILPSDDGTVVSLTALNNALNSGVENNILAVRYNTFSHDIGGVIDDCDDSDQPVYQSNKRIRVSNHTSDDPHNSLMIGSAHDDRHVGMIFSHLGYSTIDAGNVPPFVIEGMHVEI